MKKRIREQFRLDKYFSDDLKNYGSDKRKINVEECLELFDSFGLKGASLGVPVPHHPINPDILTCEWEFRLSGETVFLKTNDVSALMYGNQPAFYVDHFQLLEERLIPLLMEKRDSDKIAAQLFSTESDPLEQKLVGNLFKNYLFVEAMSSVQTKLKERLTLQKLTITEWDEKGLHVNVKAEMQGKNVEFVLSYYVRGKFILTLPRKDLFIDGKTVYKMFFKSILMEKQETRNFNAKRDALYDLEFIIGNYVLDVLSETKEYQLKKMFRKSFPI